jgi:cytochrome bd-type quinol oxidase subunit 2
MPLFTHFGTTGQVGLLDYYSLSVGLLSVVLLSAHGATFLAWRAAGVVRDRSLLMERKLWPAVAVLFAIVTLETYFVRPDLLGNLCSVRSRGSAVRWHSAAASCSSSHAAQRSMVARSWLRVR